MAIMHYVIALLLLIRVGFCTEEICGGILKRVTVYHPNFNLQDNGKILQVGGFNFTEGTFWKVNNSYMGCPCMIEKCIKHCSSKCIFWKFHLMSYLLLIFFFRSERNRHRKIFSFIEPPGFKLQRNLQECNTGTIC
jgi:hypothetical protein